MKKSYLDHIQNCILDKDGEFKYVQIKLSAMGESKIIIRGFDGLEFHKDNYDKFLKDEGSKLTGIDTEVLGGGRVNISSKNQTAYVYGYSIGYGICDHSITCKIISELYPNYKTSWSNEGY